MKGIVKELSIEEMQNVQGGFLVEALVALGGAILLDIVMNPSESWNALKEGYNEGHGK